MFFGEVGPLKMGTWLELPQRQFFASELCVRPRQMPARTALSAGARVCVCGGGDGCFMQTPPWRRQRRRLF